MRNLIKLFKIKKIVKTKSVDGEQLTEWEKDFIWKQIKKDGTITCPNCENDSMCEGPSGAMSINIRCLKCGQGINYIKLHNKNSSALDWCDNIGIDESWIRK